MLATGLKNKNSAAIFIPCAANSLNLVGQAAALCCVVVSYFDFTHSLYTFSVLTQMCKSNEVFGWKETSADYDVSI